MITENRDIGGLRSPRSPRSDSKSRIAPLEFAIGGDEAHGDARNWGSSWECQYKAVHCKNWVKLGFQALGAAMEIKFALSRVKNVHMVLAFNEIGGR